MTAPAFAGPAPASNGLKPNLPILSIINMAVGFFGLQIGFALQNANASRIFQSLGADYGALPLFWLAGPVTGLIVQPIVGYLSDRTWNRFGRRRPYFMVGAFLASIALIFMPTSPVLWIAASSLWILDSALNISMEPFRAFVGDNLNSRQRSAGYAAQGVFIGFGTYVGSKLPEWLGLIGYAQTAPEGSVAPAVKMAFFVGAAILFLAVLYTVLTSKEYSPEDLEVFEANDDSALGQARRETASADVPPASFFTRWGLIALGLSIALVTGVFALNTERQFIVFAVLVGIVGLMFLYTGAHQKTSKPTNMVSGLMSDLVTMPTLMKRLAAVQFTSWFAFFTLWVYLTPAVTFHHFGTSDTSTEAFGTGALAVNDIFALYGIVSMLFAAIIPFFTRLMGVKPFYALTLIIGGLSFASIRFLDPSLFWVAATGIGIVWASVLVLPYVLLSDALPASRMGTYMGIFNYFIVIPQLVVGTLMGGVLNSLLGGDPSLTLLVAGGVMMLGAILLIFVPHESAD
ncbi:MAG: MFS transporter [Pseudomonadota bacterium]